MLKNTMRYLFLVLLCMLVCMGTIKETEASEVTEDISESKTYTGEINKQQIIYGSDDPENPVVITIDETVYLGYLPGEEISPTKFTANFNIHSGYVKFVGSSEGSKITMVEDEGLSYAQSEMLRINEDAHVIIENIELDACNLREGIDVYGDLLIKEGTLIRNIVWQAILLAKGATVTMDGGEISSIPGSRNAYYVFGSGTFIMNGGVISGENVTVLREAIGISGQEAKFVLLGGKIEGFENAVHAYAGNLEIGEQVQFVNNKIDILLDKGMTFKVRDDFRNAASVSVADTENFADGAKRQITTPDTAETMKDKITSAMKDYAVGYESGYLYLSERVHEHDWSYEAKEHQIFASCTSEVGDCEHKDKQYVLTLTADDMEYTGAAYDSASVENMISETTGDEAGEVMYYQVTGGKEVQLPEAPTEPGDYIVTVSIADATAKAAFSITKAPEEIPEEVIEENTFKINAGLKVSQTGKKITVKWGEVSNADGYKIYLQYCGKKFGKPVKVVKNAKKTTASFKKINGKKIDLKQNFKVYVVAYKVGNGKDITLGKSITGHIVGRKNKECTNAKRIEVKKKQFTLKVGKTATIKAKTVLVDSSKRQLNNEHAKEFRYASDNKKIAKVNKKGKITAVGKGTCNVYVYARNGYAQKIKVIVE